MEAGQGFELIKAGIAAITLIAVGLLFLLPEVQRLIEQKRTLRAREREYVRRCRVEIEA